MYKLVEQRGITMVRSAVDCEEALEEWLLLFFLFSAAGWIWEVFLTAAFSGQWVNRGMLHGPWLPVYGVGGVGMAAAVRRLRHGWAAPVAGAAVGGLVEYGTALALELRFRQRWWDYTGQIGNLGGRICLASLLGFALAGWVLGGLLPRLERRIKEISRGVRTAVCRSVSLIFALDWAGSLLLPNAGAGISYPL